MKFLTVFPFLFPVLMLLASCAAHAVPPMPPPVAEPVEDASVTMAVFTGVPIIGDYDESDDLDFVIRADSAGCVYKVRVHESAGFSNRAQLRQLRGWINEIEDYELVQVSGSYTPYYRAGSIEYGALELKEIAFQDTLPGFEQPYRSGSSKAVNYSISVFVAFIFLTFGR